MKRLLLLLCCASCARELTLPPLAQRPVVTSFSPLAAYADALLTIQGANFDPVAANNVVQFTVSSARAYDFDAGGNLRVYVPESNVFSDLTGPISVSNGKGASDQSAASFSYLGRGHPYQGVPVGTTRFLHRPAGVAALAGETLVASTVAWAVMGSKGLFQQLPAAPAALIGAADGSAAFVAAGSAVMRLGSTAKADLSPAAVRALSLSPDGLHLAAVAVNPDGSLHVASLAPADLTVAASATVTGATLLGAAALAGGKVAIADASRLLLVDPAATNATQAYAAPAGVHFSGALAATSSGLAASFSDGSLRLLDTAASWGAAIATGSAEPFATLAASGAEVAGAKPVEHVVRALRVDTGAILGEHVSSGSPHAVGFSGTQVLIGDDQSNAVETMDASSGNVTARATFPLQLGGTLGCGQGSAVEEDPRPQHYRYQFLSVARATNQLFAIDYNELTVQQPMFLAPGSSPVRGVAMPGPVGVYLVHDTEIGHMRDDDTEEILTSALPGAQCLLFADSTGAAAVVLRPQDVSVLRGSTITAQRTMPGTVLSGNVRADGKIVIFYGDPNAPGASPKARLYQLAALESGGAPDAQFDGTQGYQGFIGAFPTAWGQMLFFTWDAQAAASGAFAVVLDDQLKPRPANPSLVPADGVVRVTPDGYFVVWMQRAARDDILQVLNYFDVTAPYQYEAYSLQAMPGAPAFDSSGQYMYVPEPDLDQIQTWQ